MNTQKTENNVGAKKDGEFVYLCFSCNRPLPFNPENGGYACPFCGVTFPVKR
ncbi:MAG: hypothetical protein IJO61_04615 [Oscillospiraceae bacterium]|nr:hypothetical protein [Oscillospiraceae bacterium]MBQ6846395.1 hypothetical protein [Oscillospiraceae bacterium]MBQ7119692.1 hypothetical protein [Oscillospiraceae bacterium]